MSRRLFCEISPLTYAISVAKGRLLRNMQDCARRTPFALEKSAAPLPVLIYKHSSLIRRRLGSVDMALQENKAVNLGLTAPKINGVLIKPGETFSFWRLAGCPTARAGYKTGLTISNNAVSQDICGGMCQFTNLLHWMFLHSDLQITEHHHHDRFDLFPDFNRQIPFGTGTSVFYNYIDYRVFNGTDNTYQIIVYTTDEYLCGELRAQKPQQNAYHIHAANERFVREGSEVYRLGDVYRRTVDKHTGNVLSDVIIKQNHAKVCYDTSKLDITDK